MKSLIFLLFCLISLNTYSQSAKFDGHTWTPPYRLPIPDKWTIERFEIPISFAPKIAYKGVEDIRFTPGWSKAESEEYWTYAFLWYLEGNPEINSGTISTNLNAYYTGLIEVNTGNSRTEAEKNMTVTTTFKKTTSELSDLATYTGTVVMMDYMQRKPITLYSKVHIRKCAANNKTVVFHELSPKPFSHKNWKLLDQLWIDFSCENKKASIQ
ncbi:hypothetical protein [Sediminibacterium goheungense]|uniref:Uncharacterized protein n=1 Tax=Sediminibacterium goheungense TaxID=1086393 RepID=A0A4R6J3Q1_9BACT|nr:hypothetical protein [Sediminibacterium goheungense]TDO28815.1 hypothetical protein BC659_0895 [Sediminibacterium goheungense]